MTDLNTTLINSAQKTGFTPDQLRRMIDAILNDRPGYELRILTDNFNGGRVELRALGAKKDRHKYIISDWIFHGYVDDLMRRHEIK